LKLMIQKRLEGLKPFAVDRVTRCYEQIHQRFCVEQMEMARVV